MSTYNLYYLGRHNSDIFSAPQHFLSVFPFGYRWFLFSQKLSPKISRRLSESPIFLSSNIVDSLMAIRTKCNNMSFCFFNWLKHFSITSMMQLKVFLTSAYPTLLKFFFLRQIRFEFFPPIRIKKLLISQSVFSQSSVSRSKLVNKLISFHRRRVAGDRVSLPPYPQEGEGRRYASGLDDYRGVYPSFDPLSSCRQELHLNKFNDIIGKKVVRLSRIFSPLKSIKKPFDRRAKFSLSAIRQKVLLDGRRSSVFPDFPIIQDSMMLSSG